MKSILIKFRDSQGVLERKSVEAGIGFLQWITRVFPQFRPYLSFFCRILAKADPTSQSWSRELLAERIPILDKKCQYTIPNVDGCSSKTFRIYKMDNTLVHIPEDVKNFRFGASRRGKVCMQILDPRNKNVRSDEEASRVAGIWLNAILGMPMWAPMVRTCLCGRRPSGVVFRSVYLVPHLVTIK